MLGLLAVGVVMIAGCVVALGSVADASPRTARVQADFADLVPGQTKAASTKVHVKTAATIDSVRMKTTGDVHALTWDVTLCSQEGRCYAIDDDSVGTRLAKGTYDLNVAVTLSAQASQQARPRGSVSGSVQFSELHGDEPGNGPGDGDGNGPGDGGGPHSIVPHSLASTGTFAWGLAGLMLVLLAVGTGLLLVGRRRRDDEDDDAQAGTAGGSS